MENFPNPSAEEAAKSLARKTEIAKALAAAGRKEAHESTGLLPDAAAGQPDQPGHQTARAATTPLGSELAPADNDHASTQQTTIQTTMVAEVVRLHRQATAILAEAKDEVEAIRGQVALKLGQVRGMSHEMALDAKSNVASVADHATAELGELRSEAEKTTAAARTRIESLLAQAADGLHDLRDDATEKHAEARQKADKIAASVAVQLLELEQIARRKVAETQTKAGEIADKAASLFR